MLSPLRFSNGFSDFMGGSPRDLSAKLTTRDSEVLVDLRKDAWAVCLSGARVLLSGLTAEDVSSTDVSQPDV